MILGHGHPAVVEAVQKAVRDGFSYGAPTEREIELAPQWGAGEILLELYEKLVEHTLVQPTFVQDYPESVRPLAKPHRSEPGAVERWELFIAGEACSETVAAGNRLQGGRCAAGSAFRQDVRRR